MPKVKKLPKWAIRQAGGINKKAWALARRGKGRKMSKATPRKTPRRVSGASHGSSHNPGSSKPGWGSWFKMGRTADVFSGPAQGSITNHGLTREGGMDALRRYSAGLSEGEFDTDSLKASAGGIGTGLFRQWLRSKMGIYRGIGRKKYLSFVMGLNPEILAYGEVDPLENLASWNDTRTRYDRGYTPIFHSWSVSPSNERGSRFWQSIGFDVGLTVAQKAAEKYLNPMLPKGHNL